MRSVPTRHCTKWTLFPVLWITRSCSHVGLSYFLSLQSGTLPLAYSFCGSSKPGLKTLERLTAKWRQNWLWVWLMAPTALELIRFPAKEAHICSMGVSSAPIHSKLHSSSWGPTVCNQIRCSFHPRSLLIQFNLLWEWIQSLGGNLLKWPVETNIALHDF